MLLSAWTLFTVCVGLGLLGLVLAYKHNWAAVVPVIAVLVIAAITIAYLRDPLGLVLRYRRIPENGAYILVLFWSVVLGVSLPVIGLYLSGRRKR